MEGATIEQTLPGLIAILTLAVLTVAGAIDHVSASSNTTSRGQQGTAPIPTAPARARSSPWRARGR